MADRSVRAAIISIIMFSADSFLNSAAITFSNDIVKPLRRHPLTTLGELRLARMTTVFTGALAVILALSIDSVIDILIYAYNFWAPTVLGPLIAALLGLRVSRRRFIVGAAAGIGGALLWNCGLGTPLGIDGLVVGFFASLGAFMLTDRDAMPIHQASGP
jgi:solute:Na+ symporter, SSS family